MGRVIKLIDNPDSIEAVQYTLLEEMVYTRDGESTTMQKASEIKQQIEKLLSEAKNKAEDIVQKANLEAAEIRDQALEAGYKAAAEEMEEKLAPLSELLNEALQDIASLKNSILARAEHDMVQLTIAMAEKLLCREMKQHPDAIVDIVKQAIKTAENKAEITIRISARDHAVLKQHMSQLIQHIRETGAGEEQAVSIRIVEDSDLTPGGCVVETNTNLIDMSLETRMEALDQLISI